MRPLNLYHVTETSMAESKGTIKKRFGIPYLKSPAIIDIMLRTNDGANACNVLFDVIRAIKYCKENSMVSLSDTICAYGFKSPPKTAKIRDSANFVNAFAS